MHNHQFGTPNPKEVNCIYIVRGEVSLPKKVKQFPIILLKVSVAI
jgi:hypothetical protein